MPEGFLPEYFLHSSISKYLWQVCIHTAQGTICDCAADRKRAVKGPGPHECTCTRISWAVCFLQWEGWGMVSLACIPQPVSSDAHALHPHHPSRCYTRWCCQTHTAFSTVCTDREALWPLMWIHNKKITDVLIMVNLPLDLFCVQTALNYASMCLMAS